MKKLNFIFGTAIFAMLLFAFTTVSENASAQPKWQPVQLTGFPDHIAPILANSCAGCHSNESQGKAKEFLNLSSWSKLSAKAQAKEAKAMNKQIKKGSMPPAGFLEKVPQAKLNAEQIASIKTWASDLKKKK